MLYTLADLPDIAAELLATHGPNRTYALLGELGAGKTTLIAEVCRQLGVTEPTSSPTFGIVNQYRGAHGPVYHLDCYRLESLREAVAAGLEEVFADHEDHPIFVEWPRVIEALLPDNTVVLRLAHVPGGEARTLEIDA
jgi:tRNA threonylcarbamoyladenosine biosynthesis protein TsaE